MKLSELVVLLCLAVLAGIDLKIRKIPVLPVLFLGLFSVGFRLWAGIGLWELAAGMIPGVILLGLAVCTGESIGIGDGLVLLVLGGFAGIVRTVAVLGVALVLAAALSVCLLLLKKVKRKTELPFLPCLCGGYLLCMLW